MNVSNVVATRGAICTVTAGWRARRGGERERDVERASEHARFRVPTDLTIYGQRSHRVSLRKGLATARETHHTPTPPPPVSTPLPQRLRRRLRTLQNKNHVSPEGAYLAAGISLEKTGPPGNHARAHHRRLATPAIVIAGSKGGDTFPFSFLLSSPFLFSPLSSSTLPIYVSLG